MIGRYSQTPLDLERDLGLLRGNVMHFEMSLDQMFMFRPLPEVSCYRAPMKNLYLTGASTHPGGGVFGASGRNTAKVILGWRGWEEGVGFGYGSGNAKESIGSGPTVLDFSGE